MLLGGRGGWWHCELGTRDGRDWRDSEGLEGLERRARGEAAAGERHERDDQRAESVVEADELERTAHIAAERSADLELAEVPADHGAVRGVRRGARRACGAGASHADLQGSPTGAASQVHQLEARKRALPDGLHRAETPAVRFMTAVGSAIGRMESSEQRRVAAGKVVSRREANRLALCLGLDTIPKPCTRAQSCSRATSHPTHRSPHRLTGSVRIHSAFARRPSG